jgi:DNA replication protein DnaC
MSKNEDKSTVLLKHHLKALKMPTILAECEKVAARCAQENVGHLGFLLQLCELELLELMRCEYIDKRENILLVGNSGTGKTHLATAFQPARSAQNCCSTSSVRLTSGPA